MIKYKIMMIDGKLYNFGGISGNRLAGISNNSYETKEEAVKVAKILRKENPELFPNLKVVQSLWNIEGYPEFDSDYWSVIWGKTPAIVNALPEICHNRDHVALGRLLGYPAEGPTGTREMLRHSNSTMQMTTGQKGNYNVDDLDANLQGEYGLGDLLKTHRNED